MASDLSPSQWPLTECPRSWWLIIAETAAGKMIWGVRARQHEKIATRSDGWQDVIV